MNFTDYFDFQGLLMINHSTVRLPTLIASAIFCVFAGGCETMQLAPPVNGSPEATIATTNVATVKAAVIGGTTKRGFKVDYDSGNLVLVSRPLSKLQVFLQTETIADSDDREVETFTIEQGEKNIRLSVRNNRYIKLPGGGVNNDSLINRKEFDELQDFLNGIKLQVEHS